MNSINHRLLKVKGFLVISASNWLFYRWESWGPLNVKWLPKVARLIRKRPRTQLPWDQFDLHDMTPASLHMWRPESSFGVWSKTSDKSEEAKIQYMPTLLHIFTHLPDHRPIYIYKHSHHKWLGFWPFNLS